MFNCDIHLQRTSKDRKERESAFTKILSLIKTDSELSEMKIKSKKRSLGITLDSKNITVHLEFGRRVSTGIMVDNPTENMTRANRIVDKVINYINTIFTEASGGARVFSLSFTVSTTKEPINLAKRIIGDKRIAEINEYLKQTIDPSSLTFGYKKDEKRYDVTYSFSKERILKVLSSSMVYKERLPFNLLEKEISDFAAPIELIRRLTEMEL